MKNPPQIVARRTAYGYDVMERVEPKKLECFYCLEQFPRDQLTRDHFIPRAAGATLLRNTVLACRPCNGKKGRRMPTQSEINRFHRTFGYWPTT